MDDRKTWRDSVLRARRSGAKAEARRKSGRGQIAQVEPNILTGATNFKRGSTCAIACGRRRPRPTTFFAVRAVAKGDFQICESLLVARAAIPGNYFWQPL